MTNNLIPYHRGTYFKIGFNGLLVTSALLNEILHTNFSRTKNPTELKSSNAVYLIFLDVPLPGKSSDFVGHAKFDFGIYSLPQGSSMWSGRTRHRGSDSHPNNFKK